MTERWCKQCVQTSNNLEPYLIWVQSCVSYSIQSFCIIICIVRYRHGIAVQCLEELCKALNKISLFHALAQTVKTSLHVASPMENQSLKMIALFCNRGSWCQLPQACLLTKSWRFRLRTAWHLVWVHLRWGVVRCKVWKAWRNVMIQVGSHLSFLNCSTMCMACTSNHDKHYWWVPWLGLVLHGSGDQVFTMNYHWG